MMTMAYSAQILKDLHRIFFSESSTKFIIDLLTPIFLHFKEGLAAISHLIFSLLTSLSCSSAMPMPASFPTDLDLSLFSNYYNALFPNLKYLLFSLSAAAAPPILAAGLTVIFLSFCLPVGCWWLLRLAVVTCLSVLRVVIHLLRVTCVWVLWGIWVTCRGLLWGPCVTLGKEARGDGRSSAKMMKTPGSGGRRMDRSTFAASPKAYFTGLRASSRVMKTKKLSGSNS